MAYVAPIEGEPVLVLERRGVVLRTQANASVLVMMPIWDTVAPFSISRSEVKSNVTELLLLNQNHSGKRDGGGGAHPDKRVGALPWATVADQLTVKRTNIYGLAGDFTEVPTQLELGHLSIARTPFADVVVATWDTIDLAIAIGPRIPPAFLAHYRGVTHVIGGLLPPETEEERAVYADPELYQTLESVILLLDHSGVMSWPVTLLPSFGVTVQAVGREEGSEADELVIEMKQAVDAGEWERAKALLDELSAREIEDVFDGLAIEGNLDAAKRVLAMALASEDWAEAGVIHFLDGVARSMSGDREGALASYRRSVEGEEAEPRAYTLLSSSVRRQRDHAEAIRCAGLALDALPRDAVAIGNLIAAHASAGNASAAKETIDRYENVLGSAGAMEWRARVQAWPPFEDGPEEQPYLADKAYQIGCIYASSGQVEQAIRVLERCLTLMPSHLEAVLELGVLFSACDRDRDALGLYDAVLAKAPDISFVRFNRANCLVRLERVPEAIAELERVVREVPDWDVAREALQSLL
jgi:tetratricopeptide (TPR) repeat protein